MSDEQQQQEVQANNPVVPAPPTSTPAGVENTGKTEDGREAYIPRARFDDVNAKLQQLEAWKQEREQAEMSELERLKAQLSALEPLKGQAESLNQLVEQVLVRELESVPEDKRSLIQGDTPAAKLQDLMRLKALGLFSQQSPPPPKATPVTYDANTGTASSGKNTVLPDKQSQLAAEAQRLGFNLDRQKLAERIQQSKHGGTK